MTNHSWNACFCQLTRLVINKANQHHFSNYFILVWIAISQIQSNLIQIYFDQSKMVLEKLDSVNSCWLTEAINITKHSLIFSHLKKWKRPRSMQSQCVCFYQNKNLLPFLQLKPYSQLETGAINIIYLPILSKAITQMSMQIQSKTILNIFRPNGEITILFQQRV